MTGALLGVLAASLLGSLHCAGMCGGLVALYTGSDRSPASRAWMAHAAYSGGRLAAYAALGALGGLAGAVLDLGGALAGVQRVAALAAGLLIAGWGLAILLGARGMRLAGLTFLRHEHLAGVGTADRKDDRRGHAPGAHAPGDGGGVAALAGPHRGRPGGGAPGHRGGRGAGESSGARRISGPPGWRWRVQGVVGRVLAAVAGMSPPARGLAVGLVTGLLPCGWFWAFVVVAAGTGDPLAGAALMAAFWLGTLPVMLAVGVGLRALAAPFRRYLPTASGLVMVSLGLLAVLGRLLGHHHGAP